MNMSFVSREGSVTEGSNPPATESIVDDEEDDPEVMKEREREFKKTLEVHYDPNLGAEENEINFQKTMRNFCEYLRPEYERSLERERQLQLTRYDDEEMSNRAAWIPGDEFGADGDFRSVAIAYSYEREIQTRKIGVPGHPAPALQRWRERKTVEEKAKEWTEVQTKSMTEVLSAEYDTVEEEEEAIIKLLAVKYQNLEQRKRDILGATSDPEAKRKSQRGVLREGPPPQVGTGHGMWDLLRQEFPRAPLKLPHKVEQGDIIVPNVPGEDTQAWQRNRTIRHLEARNVDLELLEAENDTPAHRYRLAMRKEDIDRCHDFVIATMKGEHYSIKSSFEDAHTQPKNERAKKKKPIKHEKGQRDLSAPGSTAALAQLEAEKIAKKQKKEERLRKKEDRKLKKEKLAVQKLLEEEAKKEKLLEKEAKRKKGFLPKILSRFGLCREPEQEESDDDSEDGTSDAVDISDPADWAVTYRNQFPELMGEAERHRADQALGGAQEGEDSFRSRAKKRAEMYREQLTDQAAKYITQNQLVQRAAEGDVEGVATAILQTDPPLDLNIADDHGMTPLVSAFRTLLSIDASRTNMEGMGSAATKVASKLNKTLQKDQELVVFMLLARGADPEIIDLSDQSPGWTILHYAASKGIEERVYKLLRHGVEVDPTDNLGATPLMEACKQGHLLCADGLIRCGAKLDRRDKNGWSALHYGAHYGRTAVCKALLLAGATKDMRNRDLKSAAEMAMARNHMRTAQGISTFVKPKIPVKRILAGLEQEARQKAKELGEPVASDTDED